MGALLLLLATLSQVELTYDEARDRTTFNVELGQLLTEQGRNPGNVRLAVFTYGQGRQPKVLGRVVIEMTAINDDWHYLRDREFHILADGERFKVPIRRETEVEGGLVLEQMFGVLTPEQAAAIGQSKRALIEVGTDTYAFNSGQRQLISHLAAVSSKPEMLPDFYQVLRQKGLGFAAQKRSPAAPKPASKPAAPKESKPAQMLRLGKTLEKQEKPGPALTYYRDLVEKYPESREAKEAAERIEELEK